MIPDNSKVWHPDMPDEYKNQIVTGDVKLFLGNCLDIVPQADVIITDPPYVGLKGGIEITGNGVTQRIEDSTSIGDLWNASLDWVSLAWDACHYGMMVFCSHHFIGHLQLLLEPYVVGLVIWHKRNSPPAQNNVPHFSNEYIWLFKKKPGIVWRALETFYDIPMLQAGCFSSERILMPGTKKALHPTQKPLALMKALLQAVPQGMTVSDWFMGLGTTGVACVEAGIGFSGVEINSTYFEIAKQRIERTKLQPTLFVPEPEQLPLDLETA